MKEKKRRPSVALAITGASGSIYAERTLQKLLELDVDVSLVFSQWARKVVEWEVPGGALAGFATRDEEPKTPPERVRVFSNENLMAPIASGSRGADALIIVPCSMGTLGRIAHGTSGSLIERAADVMLKERRPLVLVVRETPLSLVHLRNMCSLTEAGAVVMPASPGFYHRPQTLTEIVDFIAERALSLARVLETPSIAWEGEP